MILAGSSLCSSKGTKGAVGAFVNRRTVGTKKNRPRNWWESFSWRSSVNESGFIKDSGMRFCNCWVSLGGTIGTMFVSVAMYCDELAWDDIYLDVNNEDIFLLFIYYYLEIIRICSTVLRTAFTNEGEKTCDFFL